MRILGLLALSCFGAELERPKSAEPTIKERLQAIQISELTKQVAAANMDAAIRLHGEASKASVSATAAVEKGKLEACASVGGQKADDCDFDFVAWTVVKKPEPKK